MNLLNFLKSHPFAVEAFFESSLVLTYAVPVAHLQSLLPPCLTLDTLDNQYGFIAVAIVQTKKLRPKGFPKFMGNDFILTGYRVFVRYTTSQGKTLRGLYILRSETDKLKMAILGNLMTSYNYIRKNITYSHQSNTVKIEIPGSDFNIEADVLPGEIQLPNGSPFIDWKQARRYAGPLPFTFTYNAKTGKVIIIEGVRENWAPQPIRVNYARVGLIEQMGFTDAVLASAFIVQNIPYQWKKGKFDQWKA